MELKESLLNRFLTYVKTYSQSDSVSADQGNIPSTPQQWQMAEILEAELKKLGLENVTKTDSCYTYGYLPASAGMENVASVCFLAHVDTAEEVSGKDVNPLIHKAYDGKPIVLPYGNVLDPDYDKYLAVAATRGDTVISSDGNTLLGADDKAGVAEIVTALEYLVSHPEVKHGPVEVCFSPDEETGHGMDKVPLNLVKSKIAYTVDGGDEGELETECFNAYKVEVKFTGVSTHTGDARGKMVNAVTVLSSFINMLPRHEAPETTDGYTGFIVPMDMAGSIEEATVCLFLRDFTTKGMAGKISLVKNLAQVTAQSFGAKVAVEEKLQYLNMKEKISENPLVTQNLVAAYKSVGVDPLFVPIRGGTDGSRLTEMGIPTPNIFTGVHNFHSRSEWASLEQMEKACNIIINLIKIFSGSK